MSRQWISDEDQRWEMVCDEKECSTRSEPFDQQPPLEVFVQRGWYIATVYGDRCPSCRAAGRVRHESSQAAPHRLMTA